MARAALRHDPQVLKGSLAIASEDDTGLIGNTPERPRDCAECPIVVSKAGHATAGTTPRHTPQTHR
eukprot:1256896-Alexandrium_andersonii.AAC.1